MHTVNRFPTSKHVLAGATLVALAALVPSSAQAMDPFIDGSGQLNNQNSRSGAPMAVADMNADGLDDIIHLDQTRYLEIEYQQPDGSFQSSEIVDTMQLAWGMSVADLDGNGFNDIFAGDNYNRKDIYLANDDGSGYTRQGVGGPGIFVQCSSFSDIDNDGNLDLFICHDDGKAQVFHGDGTGALTASYANLDPVSTVPSDNSGNYGNVWTDYDLDGDVDLYISKCRQGNNNPNSGERLNLLFENNGDGTYSEVAEAVGLLPHGQTWATDFADIDNDGDLDAFVLNHSFLAGEAPSELYENDGTGHFTAITEAAGMRAALDQVGMGIQTYFGDFDNDGWVDLLVSSGNEQHQLFFNNGDKTFTVDNSVLPVGNLHIQSFAIGDLNNDGSVDIMAGFGSGFNQPTGNADMLLLNPATDGNHWLKVHLTGTVSNRNALGAVVTITGSWGTQIREIRAGESYGISHSHTEHFGLGPDDSIESVAVTWPSGRTTMLRGVTADQTVEVEECEDSVESYEDTDGDGYGDPSTLRIECELSEGRVSQAGDCNDSDGAISPDAEEVCDEVDNNCNDEVDDGLTCDAGSSSGGDDSSADTSGGASDSNGTTGTPDPTGTSSDTEGDTDDSAGQDGGGGGCAVGTPATDATFLFMLLGLGVAPLARRRKR